MKEEKLVDFATTHCCLRTLTNKQKFTLRWNVEKFSQMILNSPLEATFSFSNDDGSCRLKKDVKSMTFEIFLKCEFYCETVFCNEVKDVFHKECGRSSVSEDFLQRFCFRLSVDLVKLKGLENDELLVISTVEKNETKTIKYNPNPWDYLKGLRYIRKTQPASFLQEKVTLRIGYYTEFVNKAVLCESSPVFADILKSKTKENRLNIFGIEEIDFPVLKNIVDIEDIELPVLKNMVAFLNSGILRCEDFDLVCSLYDAAKKYGIQKLQKACSELLAFQMSVQTVCTVLVLSNHHRDIWLKVKAFQFFRDHAENVLVGDQWCNLMRDEIELGLEVIEFFVLSEDIREREESDLNE